MMKIAVLLFGHLRTFDQCWQGLRDNLLSKYDCDVFMHTWDATDHNTKSWHNRHVSPEPVNEEVLRRVQEYYKPKGILVEHQQPLEEEQFDFLIEPHTTVSNVSWRYMFESLNKANQLRREYEKCIFDQYELVLATRPDIMLYHPIDIEATLYQAGVCGYNLDNVRFFASVPGSTHHPTRLLICKGNDMLFFGKPCVIDRYIEANMGIDSVFYRDHLLNVVTVYTAAEIRAGLEPVPISYQHKYDWMNIAPKGNVPTKSKTSKSKPSQAVSASKMKATSLYMSENESIWKQFAKKVVWFLYGPVRGAITLAQKHEWLLKK